ncbi:venom carboxylesterase-6-like [Anopheles ziemanni]|uniref:venom carboxylesterase-6-like n=1 Tax=Anopheles ziemanni TaxID=345580 RepID=UPI00265E3CA7|nr:venom carboxylesterase-6-like [Anopheles ziemanni]
MFSARLYLFWAQNVAFLLIFFDGAASNSVKVTIKNGPIVGEQRSNHIAFEGIPYAKPPLGSLRFAPSELLDERWNEPRNTTQTGPVCLQWSHLKPGDDKIDGEEDCLFLNVYTPSLTPSDDPFPTIVHLHGGAFMYGGGGFFRPDFLLQRPLIFVTVNYRLGPLGFLSTEDDVVGGNFGLKDQVTALQWVQKNIKYFGGDAGRVTLSGFSAGGASVHLHMLSPLSRGLFRSAIDHSGSAFNPWVMVERSAEKANLIASGLGCPTNNSRALVECLRQRPAREIVRQVAKLQDFLYNPFSPLGVVVEKHGKNNPQPFLAEHPRELTRRGKFNKVPLILSVTEAEGLYPAAEFFGNASYLEHINKRWNDVLPSILDYKYAVRDVHSRDALSDVIRMRYLGKENLHEHNFHHFVRMVSNRLFFAGITELAKLMQPHISVYFYLDRYKTTYGLSEALSGSAKFLGVPHGEDILLILPSSLRKDAPYTVEELTMASKFVDMYESFAYGQQPRFGKQLLAAQKDAERISYLDIGFPNSSIVTADFLSDEPFWGILNFNDGTTVPSA